MVAELMNAPQSVMRDSLRSQVYTCKIHNK
jgi:hypothetical protein